MARINSNFLLQQFKVSKNVGANGGIRAMDADSTSTLLYVAGNFRTFTGQSANGFVRFRVKDSALLTPIVSSDVAVIKMRNIGCRYIKRYIRRYRPPRDKYFNEFSEPNKSIS